ncbi:MAG: hypothetical protein J0H29_22935 [Sphingobacteriales bacterium]|nr:hypothetical protein [Sphingobacteriales bacterium]
MKHYLLGIIAVIAAIGAVAFKAHKDQSMVYFTFNGSTTNATAVANGANWKEAPEDENCSSNNKACQIAVAASNVSAGSGRTLAGNTNVQISAIPGSPSGHYKPAYVSGSAITILNKP